MAGVATLLAGPDRLLLPDGEITVWLDQDGRVGCSLDFQLEEIAGQLAGVRSPALALALGLRDAVEGGQDAAGLYRELVRGYQRSGRSLLRQLVIGAWKEKGGDRAVGCEEVEAALRVAEWTVDWAFSNDPASSWTDWRMAIMNAIALCFFVAARGPQMGNHITPWNAMQGRLWSFLVATDLFSDCEQARDMMGALQALPETDRRLVWQAAQSCMTMLRLSVE